MYIALMCCINIAKGSNNGVYAIMRAINLTTLFITLSERRIASTLYTHL